MPTPPSTNRYFLYARKSSEAEDRQVASIDAQVDVLKELALREDLKIAEILTEARSAKSPGRPVFAQMLQRVRRGEAKGILCWKLDRLTRNPIDGGEISWMLQQGVIQHIRTYDRHYLPTDNVLMMAVELGMANQFLRDLAANVKRGLRAKCEKGWRPGPPPFGYRNSKTVDRGHNTILKDPKRFPLVRRMFDLVLSGVPVSRVLSKANDQWSFRGTTGKPLSKSALYGILTNPFYSGIFEYPTGSGSWFRGRHEPMMTEEEFHRVQAILGRPGRPRPKRHQFAFTGLIRCGECGAMVTAEEKVKRQQNGNVHYYVYYHCTKKKGPCSQKTLEEARLKAQILDVLATITIPPEFREWAMTWFRARHANEIQDHEAITRSRQSAHEAVMKKIDGLIDLRAGGDISDEEFRRRKSALAKERVRLEQALPTSADAWLIEVEDRLSFAETAQLRFETACMDDKRQILSKLGSNLALRDKTLSLTMEKTLVLIQEVAAPVRAIHDRLEPPKEPIGKGGLDHFYARSPLLQGLLDDVRTSLLERQRQIAA